MKKLPGVLFQGQVLVSESKVIIDWPVPGVTTEQIKRIAWGLDKNVEVRCKQEAFPYRDD